NGTVVNTVTGVSSGTVTFGPIYPPLGTDSYNVIAVDTSVVPQVTFNSIPSNVVVTTQPSGGGPSKQTLGLNDNLTITTASNIAVFSVYITNATGTIERTYNQANLPATISYVVPASLNFSFA